MVGGPRLTWRSPCPSGLRRMRLPRCMWRWLVWCEAGAVGSLGAVLGSPWPGVRSVRLPITCWMRRAGRVRRRGSGGISAVLYALCGWCVVFVSVLPVVVLGMAGVLLHLVLEERKHRRRRWVMALVWGGSLCVSPCVLV